MFRHKEICGFQQKLLHWGCQFMKNHRNSITSLGSNRSQNEAAPVQLHLVSISRGPSNRRDLVVMSCLWQYSILHESCITWWVCVGHNYSSRSNIIELSWNLRRKSHPLPQRSLEHLAGGCISCLKCLFPKILLSGSHYWLLGPPVRREAVRRSLTIKYFHWNSLASGISNVRQHRDLKKDTAEVNILQISIIKGSKCPKIIHQMTVTLTAHAKLLNILCSCIPKQLPNNFRIC